MKKLSILQFITVLCLFSFAYAAENAPKYGLAKDNPIFAQKIVNNLMHQYPELVTAGIHSTAPNTTNQKIIASTLNVIGKPSDPPDIDVGVHGATSLEPGTKVPKIGVMLPLKDSHGKRIGALALAFHYTDGENQVQFLQKATQIRDSVAKQIDNLNSLYENAGK